MAPSDEGRHGGRGCYPGCGPRPEGVEKEDKADPYDIGKRPPRRANKNIRTQIGHALDNGLISKRIDQNCNTLYECLAANNKGLVFNVLMMLNRRKQNRAGQSKGNCCKSALTQQ